MRPILSSVQSSLRSSRRYLATFFLVIGGLHVSVLLAKETEAARSGPPHPENVTMATASARGQDTTVPPVRVVAAHPVAYGLLAMLTKDTGLTSERATPERLPVSRHDSYLSGRGAKAFGGIVGNADALVDLRSIWPDDPLYPLARRHNIRIVEIDAANPIDRSLPGIALATGAGGLDAYPWLNPVNLGRMADIIASELERLAPQEKGGLARNLAQIRQRLVRLNADAESGLLDAPSLSVAVASPRLNTLASAFNLDVVPVAAGQGWDAPALEQLSAALKDNAIRILLLEAPGGPDLDRVLKDAGAKAIVIATDGDEPLSVLEQATQSLLQGIAGEG